MKVGPLFLTLLLIGCSEPLPPPPSQPAPAGGVNQTFRLSTPLYIREVEEMLPEIDAAVKEGEAAGAQAAPDLFERFTRLGGQFDPLIPPAEFKIDHDAISKAISLYATGNRLLDVGTNASPSELADLNKNGINDILETAKRQLAEAKELYTKHRAGWVARANASR